jgi:hypothetical protein
MNEAEEKLVRLGLNVARNAARKVYRTAPHALEEADLLSLAYYGLTQAAGRWESYCERKGYSPERLDFTLCSLVGGVTEPLWTSYAPEITRDVALERSQKGSVRQGRMRGRAW